jgi:glycosyltransferase involved in cell wall biosynthesis
MVQRLPRVQTEATFTAFVGNAPLPAPFQASASPNIRFAPSKLPTAKAPVRIAWEQVVLPFAAWRAHLDLLFCPVNISPVFAPCPAVIAIHDLIFLRYPASYHPLKQRYLNIMTRRSARHAAHVITVSENTRQDVIRLLGISPSRVTAVPNGVSEHFTPVASSEREAFRARQGVDGRLILHVGTLEPRKNLVMLLQAFARVAKTPGFEDTTLAIGGSKGWYYDEIFATAERLGLTASGRVRFLGRVPDDELPLWYNIAAVCVYPSLYEGFGLPPLEAMACGTPVVVSNTSSLPEVAGDAGLKIDPEDTSAWAGAIETVLSDSELAADMSRKGLKQAAMFSWERAARETAAVLERAAARGKTRPPRQAAKQ